MRLRITALIAMVATGVCSIFTLWGTPLQHRSPVVTVKMLMGGYAGSVWYYAHAPLAWASLSLFFLALFLQLRKGPLPELGL